ELMFREGKNGAVLYSSRGYRILILFKKNHFSENLSRMNHLYNHLFGIRPGFYQLDTPVPHEIESKTLVPLMKKSLSLLKPLRDSDFSEHLFAPLGKSSEKLGKIQHSEHVHGVYDLPFALIRFGSG